MKKLFFAMAAMAAMLTSCSKDDAFGGLSHGKVTFEVSTPELATRADYGDGTTAKNLIYAVYDVIENDKVVKTGNATLTDLKATVTIDLVEGRKYEVAFWAESPSSPYDFDEDSKTISYKANNPLTANNEAYDAFFAYVPEGDVKVGQVVNVTLKRPFAQLNVATNDTQTASDLGVTVAKTGVKVNAYTSLNLETGAVSGQQELTFAMTNKMDDGDNTDAYDWLTMNYILVNERENIDITFLFEDNKGKTDYTRPYAAVPVQRNYRTNVIGSILTDPTDFNVEIKPGVDGEINEERNKRREVATAAEVVDAFGTLTDNDPDNDVDEVVLTDDINLNDVVLLIGSTSTINAKAQNSLSTNAVTRTETETETPTIVIDGNGKTISSKATRVIRIQQSNINVEINNLTIDVASEVAGKGEGSTPDSIRGISIDSNLQNVSLTLNNCNIKFKNSNVGKDWAYAVHVVDNGYGHKVTINGGEYEGANVVNVRGANNSIVTVNNATLTSLYPANATYGACIYVLKNQGSQVFAKGNTFNGDNAVAFNLGEGTELTESGNTDNCLDYKVINGNYCIFTADGLVWVEAQADGFFAGKTVKLMSDIDMTDVKIANPIKFWNSENRTTFDGQNHTISNLTMSTTSTAKNPFGLFTGTADIMNVKFDNANISGYSYVAVVAGNLYGNIENCHVSNSSVKCTYWMAGALSGQYNSGNVTDCSVTNTTVTGPAAVGALVGNINETGGERILDNCTVTDCKVIQEGFFGGDYDKMFGAAVGLINIENSTVRFNGTVTNTTVKGEASSNDNIFGDLGSNNNVYINDNLFVPKSESQKKLEAAIAAAADGATVRLTENVVATQTIVIPAGKNITLDLNGKTLSAVDMNTIKNNGGNLTLKNGNVTRTGDVVGYSVNNASGELVVENVTITRGLYTSGSSLTVTNSNISHEQSTRHAIYSSNCEVTINSGTFHNGNAGNATLMATGSSLVTINGGTFSIADGRSSIGWTSNMIDQNSTAQVIVKGGLFNGGFRINSADTTLTIEGGEFNTNNGSAFADYSGTKVVKGGKFTDAGAQNWAKKYIAEGYEMNANGEVVAK